jgi:DNA-binding transcriptional LysR family regulator
MIKAIEERGRRWRISFTTSSLSGIQAAVADGLGISVLPARAVTDDHVVLTDEHGGFAPIENMDIAILHRPTADPMVSELTKALAAMLEHEPE